MYAVSIDSIISRLDRFRSSRFKADKANELSWSFLSFLTGISKSYLLWSGGFLGIQILEILALAIYHFIYLPPESVVVLRLLTSLQLTSLTLSIAFNYLNNKNLSDRKRNSLLAAFLLLAFGLLASLIIVSLLYFHTHLNLSTPPIYRAVLVASLLGLPLNLFSTFIIFNRKIFQLSLISLPNRFMLFMLNICSIAAIVIDQPLLYLFLRILPDSLLFTASLKMIQPLISAYRNTAKISLLSVSKFFANQTFSSALLIVLSEINLLVIYYALTKQEPAFGLLLFLLHKLIHLTQIMSYKYFLKSGQNISRSFAINSKDVSLKLIKKFCAAVMSFCLLSLCFLPLLYIKHQSIQWASPTGEVLDLSYKSLALLILLLTARSLFIIPQMLSFIGLTSARKLGFCLIANTILSCSISYFLLQTHSFTSVFSIIVTIDILTCGILTLHALRNLKLAQSAKIDSEFIVQDFFNRLNINNRQSILMIVTLWNDFSITEATKIFYRLAPNSLLKVGRYSWVVIKENLTDASSIIKKTLCITNAQCKMLNTIILSNSKPRDILTIDFGFAGIINLFNAYFSKPEVKSIKGCVNRIDQKKIGDCLEQLLNLQDLSANSNIQLINADFKSGWQLESYEPEFIRLVQEYLLAIKDDYLNPATAQKYRFKGMLHINFKGKTQSILYFNSSARENLHNFRIAAFIINLADIAGIDTTDQVQSLYNALISDPAALSVSCNA